MFHDEPALLLGPDFVAKDQAAHASMAELEADQVDRFWKRIESLRANETDDTAAIRGSRPDGEALGTRSSD